MPRLAFTLCLLPLFVVAAPVPKRVDKLKATFGDIADPKGKCKFDLDDDGALKITVPKDHPAVDPDKNGAHPPLIAKSVAGDFVLTVRMTQTPPDGAGRALPIVEATAASGLAVFAEGKTDHGVSAMILRQKSADEWSSTRWFGHTMPDKSRGMRQMGWATEASSVYLRLTRRGCQVEAETSEDGKKWEAFESRELEGMAGAVSVGPVAVQSTDGEFVVTFDHYELKELPKEEK